MKKKLDIYDRIALYIFLCVPVTLITQLIEKLIYGRIIPSTGDSIILLSFYTFLCVFSDEILIGFYKERKGYKIHFYWWYSGLEICMKPILTWKKDKKSFLFLKIFISKEKMEEQ